MTTEFASFPTRSSRSDFVAARFGDFLVESVLDVGCYEAPLRERLTNAGVRYFGVDIAGSPDQRIDLEKTDRLPFDDGQFHTVMCIEVLEHIDNCHAIFDELLRVASHYALVSLPNCWQGARTRIERGQGDFAHYGLPTERPVDRHKWFFNTEQATAFFQHKAGATGCTLKEIVVTERRRNPVLTALRRMRYSTDAYNNRYANTVFALFEKQVQRAKSAA